MADQHEGRGPHRAADHGRSRWRRTGIRDAPHRGGTRVRRTAVKRPTNTAPAPRRSMNPRARSVYRRRPRPCPERCRQPALPAPPDRVSGQVAEDGTDQRGEQRRLDRHMALPGEHRAQHDRRLRPAAARRSPAGAPPSRAAAPRGECRRRRAPPSAPPAKPSSGCRLSRPVGDSTKPREDTPAQCGRDETWGRAGHTPAGAQPAAVSRLPAVLPAVSVTVDRRTGSWKRQRGPPRRSPPSRRCRSAH
jgi:hypothetical protein